MFNWQICSFRIIRRIHNFHLNLENNLINIWLCVTLQNISENSKCSVLPLFFFLNKRFLTFHFDNALQEWHLALAKCLERSFCIHIDSIAIRHLFHVWPEQVSQPETVIWCWLRDTSMTSCLMGGIPDVAAFPAVTRDWWLLPWSQFFPFFSRSVPEQPQHLWGQKKIDASGRVPPWATHSLTSEAEDKYPRFLALPRLTHLWSP